DWLLEQGAGSRQRFAPVTYETPNGIPLQWRWTEKGDPSDVVVSLAADPGHRIDTLRFDAGGRAELRLPPGVYRYAASDGRGAERGGVAVETYSDEWRPAVPMLVPQSGAKDGDHDFRSALERAVIGALTPAAPSVAPGALAHAPAPPTVILVFGVNGVGKTTAVAKLGARLAHEGRSVLFAAADTFRAGA